MNLPVIFMILGISLFHGITTASEENKDSVKLTLFYMSYCPYCIDFIVNQLYKTWNEFKDHIKLDLVPFAMKQSYKDGQFVFKCMHGPKECVGDILHSCAIYQACDGHGTLKCPVDKLAKAMDYINCVVQQTDQKAVSDQCASQAGLEPKTINTCAQGTLGEELESAYFNQTAAFHPKVAYAPFTAFNDKHTEEERIAAQKDLRSVICKYIPDQCA